MITAMPNHPNRSKRAPAAPGSNPRPSEIKAAREAAGLTQAAAAELIHSTLRAWQNWEAEGGDEARRMHPGLFELFLLKSRMPDLVEVVKAMRLKGQ